MMAICCPLLRAQDVRFSQTAEAPLLINPASCGMYHGYYRAILNYKNQWSAIGKPYTTFMGSFDMPLENRYYSQAAYVGLGLFVYSDVAGDARFSTTQGSVTVSCIVPMGEEHKFSAGLDVGLINRSLDINAIQWPNQYDGQAYDPGLPSNESPALGSFMDFDAGAGIVYQYLKEKNAFHGRQLQYVQTGLSLAHASRFLKSNKGYPDYLYPRLSAFTAMRFDLPGSGVGLLPSATYFRQGPSWDLDIGFLLRIRTGKETIITGFLTESALSIGLHYRHQDAIIPQLCFEVAGFGFGLSYDLNISSLSGATRNRGGLEFSIRYARMKGALYKNRR